MKRRILAGCLGTVLVLFYSVRPSAASQVATADGTIVSEADAIRLNLDVFPVPPPFRVVSYSMPQTAAEPVALSETDTGSFSNLIWGYEASGTAPSRLLSFRFGSGVTPDEDCIPDVSPGGPAAISNGRGVAFDPIDGNLWITRLLQPGFGGDGYLHKVVPPNVSTAGICSQVEVLPFGDGPGGTIQDDIGALDVDPGSRHLWVAGYVPVVFGEGVERSYIYLVNRNNGSIIRFCWIPFDGGGTGNDTLAYAKLDGLPGSGNYLLTDAGVTFTVQNVLFAIDANTCKDGEQAAIVATFPKPVTHEGSPDGFTDPRRNGWTGVDGEWPGLLATDERNLFNAGGPPFDPATDLGPWGNDVMFMIDISLCAFRAREGGSGGDLCPY